MLGQFIAAILVAAISAADEPARPKWTDDLAQMKFPDAKAAGMIAGGEFKPDKASYDAVVSILELRQGKDFFPDRSIKVFLFLKKDDKLEGKKFEIGPKAGGNPHVHVQWKPAGETVPKGEAYVDKYCMKLEFGEIKDKKLPGKIYLCLPDKDKSFVAGTFELEIK